MKPFIWLVALPLIGGCATIVEGTDQTVTVISDPAGAECELRRDGEILAVVNPTPGSVSIDKSQDSVVVRCRLDGYEDSVGTLSADFQGMTFGNILFGGIIGVGVDAASGAMHEYEPTITVIMHESDPELEADDPTGTESDAPAEDGAPLT